MCGKLLNEMIVADCADRVHGCFYEHQYAWTGQKKFLPYDEDQWNLLLTAVAIFITEYWQWVKN